MKLKAILEKIRILNSFNIKDIEILDVEYDSRCIKKGDLFFAVKGPQDDGNLFIKEAIDKGCVSIIASLDFYENIGKNNQYKKIFDYINQKEIPLVIVEDVVQTVSFVSAFFYEFPSRYLKVVGITGTNGKSSTTLMIESILNEANIRNAITGTILYRYNKKDIKEIEYTTPKSLYLQRFMKKIKDEGVTHLTMEVSSHGIMLGRVIDIDYDVAIFTNLTRDHMEFHKDMEDYFDAKKKLFTEILAKSTKKNKFAIINIDCEYGARLIEFVKLLKDIKIYTYGFSKDADIKVIKHEYHDDGSLFSLDIEGKKYKFNIPIIGKHNISNAVAAIATTMLAFNIDYSTVSKGIDEIKNIPGRLERVKKGVNVFVDYAHTDDALMNVLKSIKNVFPNKKVITVFGCGGDRDKGKRPRMGKTVSDFSDYAIVTSDNPRNEEPINIINSIIASMRADMYEVIVNRKEAIKKAISMLDKNTVILIAGKGHETYQEIKGIKYAFDDREIAKEFL